MCKWTFEKTIGWMRPGRLIMAAAIWALSLHAAVSREITVFAAASLGDVLTEIGRNFQAQTGDRVEFNFGASSTLEQQIVAGAPADVFISANEGWVDRMQKAGLAMPGTRRSILSNTLVIVARAGYDRPLRSARDLTNAASLALAQPDTVPAGIYARRYLQKLGLWKTLKPKVIPAENVRAALAAVEAGNADAAIVYKTDAIIAKNLKIAVEVPAAEGPKISYAMAVVRQTAHPSGAKRFAACLLSPAAQTVFERYGFTVPVEKR